MSERRVILGVWSKVLRGVHVVNVTPHHFQRDASIGVICDNSPEVIGTRTAILARVKTQGPVWNHGRLSCGAGILP